MAWGSDHLLNPTYIADVRGAEVLSIHAFVGEITREHIEGMQGDIVAGIPSPADGRYAIGAGWRLLGKVFQHADGGSTVMATWVMGRHELIQTAFGPAPKISEADLLKTLRGARP